ncbi:MAG: Holliday junction resolvase RuvX [Chloroflexi bacterium]|nr:Holliday junction resolvase RuvX [Chloroflexota bacterium]
MARSLGLDVGDRRVGIALSDTTKLIARPLCIIDRRLQNAVAEIHALAREHQVDEIVIGIPLHINGRIGEQVERVEAFAAELRAVLDIAVRYHDERHSTRDARAIISAKKRRQQEKYDDAIAASVILQRHLDSLRALDFDEGFDEKFDEKFGPDFDGA